MDFAPSGTILTCYEWMLSSSFSWKYILDNFETGTPFDTMLKKEILSCLRGEKGVEKVKKTTLLC